MPKSIAITQCVGRHRQAGESAVLVDNIVYVGSKQGCVLNLSSSYSLDLSSVLRACAGGWKPLSFGAQSQMCAPRLPLHCVLPGERGTPALPATPCPNS